MRHTDYDRSGSPEPLPRVLVTCYNLAAHHGCNLAVPFRISPQSRTSLRLVPPLARLLLIQILLLCEPGTISDTRCSSCTHVVRSSQLVLQLSYSYFLSHS